MIVGQITNRTLYENPLSQQKIILRRYTTINGTKRYEKARIICSNKN